MFEYENNTQNSVITDEDQELQQIVWSAQEYQAQNKSFVWYALLYLVGIILITASIIFYHKEIVKMLSIILVIISIIASLHIISNKKPKIINYKLDEDLITVNSKIYSLGSFRSFSTIIQNNTEEVRLTPVSSTQPNITIRLDDKTKANVLTLLSNAIPYEQVNLSFLDKISNKLGI